MVAKADSVVKADSGARAVSLSMVRDSWANPVSLVPREVKVRQDLVARML